MYYIAPLKTAYSMRCEGVYQTLVEEVTKSSLPADAVKLHCPQWSQHLMLPKDVTLWALFHTV